MATMKIRYVGGFEAVDLPLEDGSVVTVQRNHQVEVDEDLARNLLHQDIWEKVKPPESPKKVVRKTAPKPAAKPQPEPVTPPQNVEPDAVVPLDDDPPVIDAPEPTPE